MTNKFFSKRIRLLALLIVVLNICLMVGCSDNQAASKSDPAQVPVAAAATVTTIVPTTVIAPPSLTVVPSLVPTTVAPPTTEVPVGGEIVLPISRSFQIKLIKVAANPLITLDDAKQIMYTQVKPQNWVFADGAKLNNKLITLTAIYGSITIGYRAPDGLWAGSSLNTPVMNCDFTGTCTPTGEVLDHIENRPVWVLDYAGFVVPMPRAPCEAGKPCNPPPDPNHGVYIIDAQMKAQIFGTYYYAP